VIFSAAAVNQIPSLGIVLVLVVVLVLGASTFCAGKDYRLSWNYFVPLVWLSNLRILEDEDDDEHDEDSSTSEFRFKLAPRLGVWPYPAFDTFIG
jgi:hypothetical protein